MNIDEILSRLRAKQAADEIETAKNDDPQKLLDLLLRKPTDLSALEKELWRGNYSKSALTRTILKYLDESFCEANDYLDEDGTVFFPAPASVSVFPDRLDTHIVEVVSLFLRAGLDPNGVYDGCSIMESLKFVDNEYLAADALALLFEHGGDVELTVGEWKVFDDLDFDVIFDLNNQACVRKYDALLHCWMVWIGYGAKPKNSFTAVDVVGGFDLCELRNHRNFTFALTDTPRRGENWTLHIIDRRTFWEVARL